MEDSSTEGQRPEDGTRVARGRRRLRSPRILVTAIGALALFLGAQMSYFNPVQAVASLASSITSPTSSTQSGQSADLVYCPTGAGGWAPTFRWHYGQPSPDTAGFDDSYSPSVQPDCTSGVLKITLVDQVTVPAGTPFWAGYDFHSNNKTTYVTTGSPTVTLNLSCASGTAHPATFTKSWGGQSYTGPPNTWTPDNNNNHAASAFQSGSFLLPAACGTGKSVIVTGGTFTTQVTAHQ